MNGHPNVISPEVSISTDFVTTASQFDPIILDIAFLVRKLARFKTCNWGRGEVIEFDI
jgi:hypothetical protein